MNVDVRLTLRSNLVLFYSLLCLLLFANSTAADTCRIPEQWEGLWFLKSAPDPIRIHGTTISEKGVCRTNSSDKFLIYNSTDGCVRCMVIYQKHKNVLQYKETSCITEKRGRIKTLNEVCGEINGDNPLVSLFRHDAVPEVCPFTGHWQFLYSKGQGECKDPMSTIQSCTDHASVIFKFKACHDVGGSESKDEKLECFAEWKDGQFFYLVGKVTHNLVKTDEDRFRCYVLDKVNSSAISMAQSSSASCDNLLSPSEGSLTMKIYKTATTTKQMCEFPTWILQSWKSLDGADVYNFSNFSFRTYNTSTPNSVIRDGYCVRHEKKTDAFTELIVHSTNHW
ncbi:uncharacterized protein B4U80_01533 [Leptotrombidium deliense]|uniref:Uncharacterized protein n=1 Tax=Leptotrombidium deliense TaxID=299467 RepID=A0A443SWT6_9ACAR|nr:uncharacterized protein B4U80_01533 [Leptotrombidium deliense]